jgi:sodium/potassium-transporting ATPase subunit alpha
MTVVSVTALDQDLKHTGVMAKEDAAQVQHIAAISGLCNAASFEQTTEDVPANLRPIRGDATDTAILRFADSIRPIFETGQDWQEIFRIDFNSKTKFSECRYHRRFPVLTPVQCSRSSSLQVQQRTPIMDCGTWAQTTFCYWPKVHQIFCLQGELHCRDYRTILTSLSLRCSYALDPATQTIVPLDDTLIARLGSKQQELAARGQRVILLTQKVLNRLKFAKNLVHDSSEFAERINAEAQSDLVVVGMLGLVDPPKEDVRETIGILRKAYIRCYMVTGDFASSE